MSKALMDVLIKDKVVSQAQQNEVSEILKSKADIDPVRHVVSKGYVSEQKLLHYLNQRYGLPSVNLLRYELKPDIIALVPPELARKHQLIPLQQSRGVLVCAAWDPTVLMNIDDLKFRTKLNIEVVLTTISAIDTALNKYYPGSTLMAEAVSVFQKAQDKLKEFDFDKSASIQIDVGAATDKDAPVISLVNNILVEAMRRSASDIHIESYEHTSRVRMRIDGVLQEVITVPREMRRPLIARIKIMSKLDISESRLPQDGRIKIKVGNGEVDFRVSTMPCLFGEKVVLRLLPSGSLHLNLNKLGFETKTLETFRRGIHQPNGMVLVTGPTGSGKTTTLYSALTELNQVSDNISTVEDPVEYNLEGINQVQINKEIDLTFASVLRTFLRQDPDIILVGEIRDLETAEVAIQAALTGHLVLSTLHTNDAPSTIVRLMNMGLEPFLVTASVNTIIAQRLLRTICPKCKEPMQLTGDQVKEAIGLTQAMRGRGCVHCNKTGYKGRIAIYEVMDFSQSLKEKVLQGCTAIELKKAAIKEGMKTLRLAALQKVLEGVTTLEEALSMTSAD